MNIIKLSCISFEIDGIVYTRDGIENNISYILQKGIRDIVDESNLLLYNNILTELDNLNIVTVYDRYSLKPNNCFST